MNSDPHLFRELQSIRAEHAPSFRAGTPDLQQRWLDSIFSEAGGNAEPEISDTLGFSTYAYFSRRYREYFGVSPQKDKS